MTIGDNIRRYRELAHMTQEEVAKKINVTPQAIYKYEKGIVTNIPLDKLKQMAKLFDIAVVTLVDWDANDESKDIPSATNVFPMPQTHKVPLVGSIACGTPITAEQNIEAYLDIPSYVRADFCLTCKGDSMINARIFDGDIVCIRQQDTVDNGQIAAVLIGDEATLKRVQLYKDHISLEAENPMYKPQVYWEEAMNEVRILGLATHFISTIR